MKSYRWLQMDVAFVRAQDSLKHTGLKQQKKLFARYVWCAPMKLAGIVDAAGIVGLELHGMEMCVASHREV